MELIFIARLDLSGDRHENVNVHFGGRTGFDLMNAPEAACRGWFVGPVKNRTKTKQLIKN
jgi:beta-lactamase class D